MDTEAPDQRSLIEAWHDVQARIAEHRPSQRQGTARPFVQYAWDEFDAREVAAILATPGDSYYGHKDILYEGFCAWIACPKKPALARSGMVLRTAMQLDAAEKAGRDKFENVGQIGDIYARVYLGNEFLEEIYYPIVITQALARRGFR